MKIINKRADFDYVLTGDRFEAGLSLLGIEAKQLRDGRGDISKSYIKFNGEELFLVNANIPAAIENYNPTRSRKLLLHKKELLSLRTKTIQQKLQIVPILIYNKGRLIKIEVGIGKPRREFEKRETIKKKDVEREMARSFNSN